MAFPLHKVSQQLLSLLRLRTLGTGPNAMSEQVAAVVPATPFYGADLQVIAQSGAGPAALPLVATGTAQFPGRLLAMSALYTVGAAAGTQARIRIGYKPAAQFSFVDLGFLLIPTPVAAAQYSCVVLLPEPIVFQPGAQFTAEIAGNAAGADHQVTRFDLFENYAP